MELAWAFQGKGRMVMRRIWMELVYVGEME